MSSETAPISHNQPQQSPGSTLLHETILACCLVLLIVGCRWAIDTPNFKPVMAVTLFAGFLFSRRWMGIVTLAAGMLISDTLLGFYEWHVQVTVYFALLFPLVLGLIMKRWKGDSMKLPTGVLGFAGLSAVNFYVLTTIAVWGWSDWYPQTISGLASAFAMGLPFLKWTLAGNLFFSVMLFGGWAAFTRVTGDSTVIVPQNAA